MEHLTTGKNKEQFEKWYSHENGFKVKVVKFTLDVFYQLPIEMQSGVMIAYYDSLNKNIITLHNHTRLWCWRINSDYIYTGFNSRPKALKAALIQADKIINKKL